MRIDISCPQVNGTEMRTGETAQPRNQNGNSAQSDRCVNPKYGCRRLQTCQMVAERKSPRKQTPAMCNQLGAVDSLNRWFLRWKSAKCANTGSLDPTSLWLTAYFLTFSSLILFFSFFLSSDSGSTIGNRCWADSGGVVCPAVNSGRSHSADVAVLSAIRRAD